MMIFIKKAIQFLKDVANDERIPSRDKKVLLALIVLILSPLDLIPDWIPFIGLLDDLMILSLVMDYFFRVLDSSILLGHYPWKMNSFGKFRRVARFIALLAPKFIKKKLWSYTGTPYDS